MSKGRFLLQHLENLTFIPSSGQVRFLLGAALVGQNEVMSHTCLDHRIVLIGVHAWEQIQEELATVRLSRDGHAMIANVEVEPFEHTKHATLLHEAQRCAQIKKREPWQVYQP